MPVTYGIVSPSHTFRRFEVSHVHWNNNSFIRLRAKHAQGVEHYVI